MTRPLGISISLGHATGVVIPTTPLTILGASLLQWCRADAGNVTIVTGVSQWNDTSGNGKHYTQATGANQPAYDASGGPNGTPFLNFDGSNDSMQAALALPDPTTTPSLCYLIMRQDSWTAGRRIFGDSGGFQLVLYQNSGSSPNMRITATIDGGQVTNATIGSWVRIIAYFSDSTSDYLQCKATKASGTSVASAAGTNRQIGCSGGASFSDCSIAEICWVNRDLSAGELSQMDAYVDARYGSGLTS